MGGLVLQQNATKKMNYKPPKLDDGKGDIKKRWHVYYSFKNPENGKFIRFQVFISSKLKTKTARHVKAKEIIDNLNSWLQQGGSPFDTELKLKNIYEAIEYVAQIKESMARKRTIQSYSSLIERFKTWLQSNNYAQLSAMGFNYSMAIAFMDYLKFSKIGNRTYNNYLGYMRIFFNLLRRREIILNNPFEKIEMQPITKPAITAFTIEERLLITEKLPAYNKELWLVSQFIYYCFIRVTELTRLQISDINLLKNEITLRPGVSKNRKQAVIIIPAQFSEILATYNIYQWPGNYFLFSRKLKPGTIQITHNRIDEIWLKFAKLYNIGKHIYDMKHTGVGVLLESGVDIRDIQLQLRHHSLEITQIYLEKFRARASEKLRITFPRF
jgi:integrase/recombinase XerD